MKKSSDQEGFFNIYPFITSPSTLDQDEQKTHPAIKLKYWVSRNSVILLILVALSHCSYKPVVDTSGRSGTFPSNKASEITNDLQHCKILSKTNSSLLEDVVFWIGSPTAETKTESIYRKCLTNRGHSVLNWLRERRKIWQKIIKNGMRTKDNLIIV